MAARGLVAVEPPAPQSLARHIGAPDSLLLAKSHQGTTCGHAAEGSPEEGLHVGRHTVVAEGGLQGRQLLETAAEVVVQREERESRIARGRHLVGLPCPRHNLQPAVQGVETSQVCLETHDKECRQLGHDRAHQPVSRDGGQVVQDDEVIVLELRRRHAREFCRQEEVHLVVGVVLDGAAQGRDVGVRRRSKNGYLLVSVDDLDDEGAAVVGRGLLVGVGCQCQGVAL